MTPDEIAAANPSDLAPVLSGLLSRLEAGRLTSAERATLLDVALTPDQKAALDAAVDLDADNRPLVLGDDGDLTAAQLAALLDGGGGGGGGGGGENVLEATVTGSFMMVDGETITVTIDGNVEATISLINDAGSAAARTGAKAANVDVGGGQGEDRDSFAGELGRALRLIIAEDEVPFEVEPLAPAIGYTITGGGTRVDHGGGIRIKAPGATTLVVASDHEDVTIVNP